MLSLFYLLAALLVLQIVVVAHELGHWMAFRACGIPVPFFGVGFGKSLFHFRAFGTEFHLRLIPLGGSVEPMHGALLEGRDEKELEEIRRTEPELLDRSRWVENASPLSRLIGAAAGPVASAVFAFLIGTGYYACKTTINVPIQPTVTSVAQGSAAEAMGLAIGDRIEGVNGHPITSFVELKQELMLGCEGETITVRVSRDGTPLDCRVASAALTRENSWTVPQLGVGVEAFGQRKTTGPVDWATLALVDCWRVVDGTGRFISGVFAHPTVARHAAGPIGMVRTVKSLGEVELLALLWAAAMLSMALAVFNIIPLAILDGTRMLFELIQIVFRRALPIRLQHAYMIATGVLVLVLMLTANTADVIRLIVT